MIASIYFDHQQKFTTIKISYIRSQRFLSGKLIAKRSSRKHTLSDNCFSHGWSGAIFSRIDLVLDTIGNEGECHGVSGLWAKTPPPSAPPLVRGGIGREFFRDDQFLTTLLETTKTFPLLRRRGEGRFLHHMHSRLQLKQTVMKNV